MFIKYEENEKLIYIKTSDTLGEGEIEISEEEYNRLDKLIDEHVALINSYVQKIIDGEMALEDVPEEYYAEVEAIINTPEPEEPDITQSEEYLAGYDQAVLDLLGGE